MLMTNFLRDRKSIREFRNKNVDVETINEIQSFIKTLEEEAENVKFKLYENGDHVFHQLKGVGGYSGLMIESPHYIALEQMDNERDTLIYGAYHMEELITELNRLGLDTCWISLDTIEDQFKETVFGEHKGTIDYMIAVGYGRRRNPFVKEVTSQRLGVDEIVYSRVIGEKVDDQEMEQRGLDDIFYYVRFAPSRWNMQPWRFLLGKDKLTLLIKHKKDETQHFVEAGIIMYYFIELAKTIRLESQWEPLEGTYLAENDVYEYVAEIKL